MRRLLLVLLLASCSSGAAFVMGTTDAGPTEDASEDAADHLEAATDVRQPLTDAALPENYDAYFGCPCDDRYANHGCGVVWECVNGLCAQVCIGEAGRTMCDLISGHCIPIQDSKWPYCVPN